MADALEGDDALATDVMAEGLVGREVTRLLLDAAVTLQLYEAGGRTAELRLSAPFVLTGADGAEAWIDPEALGPTARLVAALHGAIVGTVQVRAGRLAVGFTGGRRLAIDADPHYEAWAYSCTGGGSVTCLPGGGVMAELPRDDARSGA